MIARTEPGECSQLRVGKEACGGNYREQKEWLRVKRRFRRV